MSLNLNQRIDAFKKHTLKHHVFVASSRYSVLAIALSAVVLSPSITAKPLLDVNQPSTVVQGTSSFEQVLAQVRAYQNQQASWQVQQQMANAQLKQSGLWTNPSISIEQTGLQIDQDRELAIGISQPLDLFGQCKAAQAVAKLSASQVDLDQRRYDAELELIVQYLWSQVAQKQLAKRFRDNSLHFINHIYL